MLDADRDELVRLLRIPLYFEDLLAVFLDGCKMHTLLFLILLSQIEQMNKMVVAHVSSSQVFAIGANSQS